MCVCLRSTDLVMNNLFHAGNTFCETQQSSVETLQSTDWGVLNYNSTTLLKQQRNTLSLAFSKDVTFICMSQPRHTDTNRAFLSIKETAQKPAESVLQCAEPHLHIMTACLPQFAVCAATVRHSRQPALKK